MDPQERTLCVPFLESVGLGEPFRGSTVMCPAGNVVIFGRVWRRKPISNFLLQMVPWETIQRQRLRLAD